MPNLHWTNDLGAPNCVHDKAPFLKVEGLRYPVQITKSDIHKASVRGGDLFFKTTPWPGKTPDRYVLDEIK